MGNGMFIKISVKVENILPAFVCKYKNFKHKKYFLLL